MRTSKTINVLMLTSVLAFAQGNQKTSYLGVNLGLAFPTRDYSSNENKKESGYALAGVLMDVEGAIMFHDHFGIGGKLGVFANAMDVESAKKKHGVER